MTESERARLRAELRALVAENANFLGLAPAAALDVVNRLVAAGAVMIGDRPAMPCGMPPLAYIESAMRSDPGAAHIFSQPEAVTHVPAKPATPKGLSADEKLARANGHPPLRRRGTR